MLDKDLAELYEIETRILKRNVRKHLKRFPSDFMFELSNQEFMNLRSQIGISKAGGTRFMPMAFTEQGVAMLSGILNSDRVIEVNIQIMRTFTKLRHMIAANEELKKEIEELRGQTDERFQIVFETLDQLIAIEKNPKERSGFEDIGRPNYLSLKSW